jgi:type III secretion system low calcium response chaperone LcrH/SycD
MTQPKKEAPPLTSDMAMDAMLKVNEQVTPELQEGIQTIMSAIFQKGITPKDALGLSDEVLEGMYGHAYHLFNNGKYDDALIIFRLLTILNGAEPRFSMGMAACHHMRKEYDQAAQMYGICGVIDWENPMPYYHASDCWIKKGDIPMAIEALKVAAIRAEQKPQYAVIRDRCLMALKSLEEGQLPPDVSPTNAPQAKPAPKAKTEQPKK